MLYEDRKRAESFGTQAERYDRARPDYPSALVDELVNGRAGVSVLDVGCGTGIAARQFLARGCTVLGVEPDPRMAVIARRRGIAVEEARFEEWNARGRTFDLLICGQAWHWVEPGSGTAKAAETLGEGGRLGIFWNHGTPEPSAREALGAVYLRTAHNLDDHSILIGDPAEPRVQQTREALAENEHFESPQVVTYEWTRVYSRDQWLDHLPTHSDHMALGPAQLDTLLEAIGTAIDDLGGSLTFHYTTWLVTARRRAMPVTTAQPPS